MRHRPSSSWCVAFVLLLALGACTDEPAEQEAGKSPNSAPVVPAPAALARFYDQQPEWRPCPKAPAVECATVRVPLDYDAPDGATVDLAVNRIKATGGSRIGSLLVNPGGPGASGVDYVAEYKDLLASPQLRERYDLVGFDPRGVARSAPIECVGDGQLDELLSIDGSPDDAKEEQALTTEAEELATGCATRSAQRFASVGSRDTVQDMDILRAVLNEEKLNYLGSSYGTYLGALYADAYPGRVGRFVLDGALDPKLTNDEIARGQAEGFEAALQAFAEDCVRQPDCPFQGDPQAVVDGTRRVLARADSEPLPTESGREVTQSLATLAVVYGLYQKPEGWAALRDALELAKNGFGDALLDMADLYADRKAGGRYGSNAIEALTAINCIDRPAETDLAKIRASAAEARREVPTFGSYLVWSNLPCARWKAPPQRAAGPVQAKGSAPILVLGTTRDPATPLAWSESLAEQLDNAALVVRDGDGHLAYRRNNACVDQAVDAYLLSGTQPAHPLRC